MSSAPVAIMLARWPFKPRQTLRARFSDLASEKPKRGAPPIMATLHVVFDGRPRLVDET